IWDSQRVNVVIDPSSIATNLERGADGIWIARSARKVSYPEEGNEDCFQIEDDSFWFRHRNLAILEVMRQFPPSGAVFDIGGGNGFVARAIEAAGYSTVLVEPGTGAFNARARGLSTVIQATLEDAKFRNGSLPA